MVSPLFYGQNTSNIKLRLKTLINIINLSLYDNYINSDYEYIIKLNQQYIDGILDKHKIRTMVQEISNNNYINIVVYYEYKIFYDLFSDSKIIFKNIFYDKITHYISDNDTKIFLLTENNNIIISYYTLCLIVIDRTKKTNIDDILKKDKYFSEIYNKYEEYNKDIIIRELKDIQTNKNEIMNYFVHIEI